MSQAVRLSKSLCRLDLYAALRHGFVGWRRWNTSRLSAINLPPDNLHVQGNSVLNQAVGPSTGAPTSGPAASEPPRLTGRLWVRSLAGLIFTKTAKNGSHCHRAWYLLFGVGIAGVRSPNDSQASHWSLRGWAKCGGLISYPLT